MSADPFFSVILPVYNGAAFLAEAIRSVTGQTYTNWELIIVDDASTDNSHDIALSYSSKDKRIRVLQQQQNKGVSAARNLAVSHAKGDWLALLDTDDKWFPEKLEVQAPALKDNQKIALLYSKGLRVFENYSGPAKNKDYGSGNPGLMKNPFLKTLNGFITPTSGVVLNKHFFEKAGGFDESMDYSEDTLLFHKILLFGDLYFIDRPLLEARHHDASAKQTVTKKKMIRARLTVYLKLLDFDPAKNYKKEISFQAATTGMERVWKYFFRNPFQYCTVLTSALCKVCVSKKIRLKHKVLAWLLPLKMLRAPGPYHTDFLRSKGAIRHTEDRA